MLENAGFVALDIPNLIDATIVDINYENTWFDRDGTWDFGLLKYCGYLITKR